jgi:hypothetical protein
MELAQPQSREAAVQDSDVVLTGASSGSEVGVKW